MKNKKQVGKALGRVPSGLFIVTAKFQDKEDAVLASWINQCSFDPPEVTVSLGQMRNARLLIESSQAFIVNVLGKKSNDLMKHFLLLLLSFPMLVFGQVTSPSLISSSGDSYSNSNVNMDFSHNITKHIDGGDLSLKPGWIRMSIHPTMTDEEIHFIMNAIVELSENHIEWGKDYIYNNSTNEFVYKDISFSKRNKKRVENWFKM